MESYSSENFLKRQYSELAITGISFRWGYNFIPILLLKSVYRNGQIKTSTIYGNGKTDLPIQSAKITHQPNSKFLPFIEMAWMKNKRLYTPLCGFEIQVEIFN